MQINQPIIRSDIVKVLQSITGVYSVSSLDFTFTDTSVKEENGIFKVPNEDSIFEIDNFATDIAGIVR
jgi:hypothetical protein